MKLIVWIIRVVIFFILFGFALMNSQLVHLHFFFGKSWELPLVIVLAILFALGIFLGGTVNIIMLLSKKHEISRLKRQLKKYETQIQQATEAHVTK